MSQRVYNGLWGKTIDEWNAWAKSVGFDVDFHNPCVELGGTPDCPAVIVFPTEEEAAEANRAISAEIERGCRFAEGGGQVETERADKGVAAVELPKIRAALEELVAIEKAREFERHSYYVAGKEGMRLVTPPLGGENRSCGETGTPSPFHPCTAPDYGPSAK